MTSFTIAVLIPAHNEEKSLAACILSCLNQTRVPDEIVVVNDGSTDGTAKVLEQFSDRVHVVTTPRASGSKSKAQQLGLGYITSDIVVATDADTILETHFIEHIECSFIADPEVAAVAGYVKSIPYNYLTGLREIEYIIGQDFYKLAQAHMNYIYVIAGCAGAFKTRLFTEGIITFDHDTLTEDLDFTYKMHELGLPIRFNTKAICYTQDPHTLHSYTNQLRRWYAGGWQNLMKHAPIMFKRPSAAVHLSLGYVEGLLFPITLITLLLVNWSLLIQLLLVYTVMNICLGAYAAWRRQSVWLLLYSPLMTPLKVWHAYLFIEQFLKEVILKQRNLAWFQPERRVL